MIIKTQAICIKNTRFGESGVICKLFTLDRGLSSFLIQGIIRKTSLIKSSHIMPGNIIEIVYYKKPSAAVNRIKEIKVTECFHDSENDILKNAILQFVLEIISKTNEDEASDENIFYFIKDSLEALKNEKTSLKYYPIIFLCKYLKFSGWYPNLDTDKKINYFNLNEGRFLALEDNSDKSLLNSSISEQLFEVFNVAESKNYSDLNLSLNHKQILKHLISYYEIHLLKGKKIKSPEILSEIIA